MSEPKTIDFGGISGPVYTGRERGEQLRSTLGLDVYDSEPGVVEVVIPPSTYTISSSFFLGLFGPSVVKAGSKEAFYDRYHFTSPKFLENVMDGYVTRALQSKNLFA
ncbi:hypothetical protein JNX00_10905 [Hydrogenophaga sp. YM1]|uniref:hypothetical protein n=1 Tax=Hydrogenophaga sp. YM1 TaxID=2806262 RepID=UPI00195C368B|nr:hypothetical protein [Hydrogenophaga sp. YM1]QRR36328.1 hypothetical protein JNX00_10905 [Hydrogenophaga sp. YM1]